jgi:hypothetical protein
MALCDKIILTRLSPSPVDHSGNTMKKSREKPVLQERNKKRCQKLGT